MNQITPYGCIGCVPESDGMTEPERIGKRVQALRKQCGWSQEELGDKAGLNTETINRIELGGNTTLRSLFQVAAALGVSPDTIFSGTSVVPLRGGLVRIERATADSENRTQRPNREHEVLILFRALSASQQDVVLELLRLFFEARHTASE